MKKRLSIALQQDLKKNILNSIDNYLDNLETSLTRYKEFKNTT